MNTHFLPFLLALVVIIISAKLAGYISMRLGQPSVLGELLAGLLLGPSLLDMLHAWPVFAADDSLGDVLKLLADLGVVLLMFLAGLELDLSELLESSRVASLAGVLGVVVPLAAGAFIAIAFGAPQAEAVFVGLALSATSVSISVQTLIEMNALRGRVGLSLLGAAVFDDILVLLLLSMASAFLGAQVASGQEGSVLLSLIRMAAFVAAAVAVGYLLIPRLAHAVDRLPISHGALGFALVVCLLFAWAAEAVGGIAAITGAFLAGLFVGRTEEVQKIEREMSALAYGFFVPIFFVDIGLESDLHAVGGGDWIVAIVLAAAAILSKIIGSGLGARLGGLSRLDALRVGIGMVSRGEVGLIVASVALADGLVSQSMFSILVFVIIIATLVTPPLLRYAYRRPDPPSEEPRPEPSNVSSVS